MGLFKKASFLENEKKKAEAAAAAVGTADQNGRADNAYNSDTIARTLQGIDLDFSKLRAGLSAEELDEMKNRRDELVSILNGDNGVTVLTNDFSKIDAVIQAFADRWLEAANAGDGNTAKAVMEAITDAVKRCRIDPPSGHNVEDCFAKRLKFLDRVWQYINLAECLDDNEKQNKSNSASYRELKEEHNKLRQAIRNKLPEIGRLGAMHSQGITLTDEEMGLLGLGNDEQRCADNMRELITYKESIVTPNINSCKKQMDTLWFELKTTPVDAIDMVELAGKIAEGNKARELEIASIQESIRKLQGLNAAHKAFIDKLANDPVMLAEREKMIANLIAVATENNNNEAQIAEAAAASAKRLLEKQKEAELRQKQANEMLEKYAHAITETDTNTNQNTNSSVLTN